MKKTKLKYTAIDYLVVRQDIDEEGTDVAVIPFSSARSARSWVEADVANAIITGGISADDLQEEKNSWIIELDGLCVSWEIRKVHHRADGTWNRPEAPVSWEKV